MKIILYLLAGTGLVAILGIAAWVMLMRSLETPAAEVLTEDGDFQIRAYPELTVAEVTMEGGREAALRSGFGPLARYIFAKEREGEKISMTAPVLQAAPVGTLIDEVPADGSWTIRFVMPAEIARDDLPAPANAEVSLTTLPPARYAALRFSGNPEDADMAEKGAALLAWVRGQGARPAGPPLYAYYDDPMTPGFLRRNEVLIPLEE